MNLALLTISLLSLLAADPEWWQIDALRARLGAQGTKARLLGHDFGPREKSPEYAFLAAEVSPQRSVVVLNIGQQRALITCDIAKLETTVATIRYSFENKAEPAPAVNDVASVDLRGVRIANWVVLFHSETYSARSPLSFDVEGTEPLRFLITGLAPGTWEIWRNGWLEDPSGAVGRTSGALYFEGRPGSYFLRRVT
jgi:hypothetical protein